MTPAATARFFRMATPENLEQAGFVRCREQDCKTFVDPVNVPDCRCREHQARPSRRHARHPYIARDQARWAA